MRKYKVTNLSELKDLVDVVAKDIEIKKVKVLALVGDLGAGKTTFVQLLAKKMGVNETVNSPTFTIMKKYKIPSNNQYNFLVHMDVYRLDDVSELGPLNFKEMLQEEDSLVCIEWADKVMEALPENLVCLTFSINDNNEREVLVEGLD